MQPGTAMTAKVIGAGRMARPFPLGSRAVPLRLAKFPLAKSLDFSIFRSLKVWLQTFTILDF